MKRLLLAVLLSLGALPGVTAAQVSDAQFMETMRLWGDIRDPCRGVRNSMLRQGPNPFATQNPIVPYMRQTAWARMLPVLVGIADTPSIVSDKDALTALIDGSVSNPPSTTAALGAVEFP